MTAVADSARSGFFALNMQNFKAPAAEAEKLLAATQELKLADGTYSADLTEDGREGTPRIWPARRRRSGRQQCQRFGEILDHGRRAFQISIHDFGPR